MTIISETATSEEELIAALVQNLRIHDCELIQQGSSFLIYKNKNIRAPADLLNAKQGRGQSAQIATEVFIIEYVDPARVAAIVKNMVSQDAIVELIAESKRLIVTDVASNIKKISQILTALDSPKSGLEIGQYVGQNASPAALIGLTQQLLEPLLAGQPFVLVPHGTSNSVFVVSSPFLVEKALSVMQKIDMGENVSQIFSLDKLKFDTELAKKHHQKKEQAVATPEATTGFSKKK